MNYEIDTKNRCLVINGNYIIEFDRLTKKGWLQHICEKETMDILEVFVAFCDAYRAAGINTDRALLQDYREACEILAISKFYSGIAYLGFAHRDNHHDDSDDYKLFDHVCDIDDFRDVAKKLAAVQS